MDKEKLIEELDYVINRQLTKGESYIDRLADWVIADRKRICEPLVKYKEFQSRDEWRESDVNIAIDETLTLAGIGDEREDR